MRTYGFECKLLVQLFNRTYTKLCKETAGKSIAQHVAKGSHPKPGKARPVRTNFRNWKPKFHLPSFGRSLSCEPADVLPFAEAAYHNSSESLLLSRMAIWCRHLHVDSSRSKHEMNWNEIKLSLSFTRCASPWIPLLSTLIVIDHPDCNFESGSLTSSHRVTSIWWWFRWVHQRLQSESPQKVPCRSGNRSPTWKFPSSAQQWDSLEQNLKLDWEKHREIGYLMRKQLLKHKLLDSQVLKHW